MAIWRGVGGAGDATVDATNEAAAAVTAANNAATSASAAAASATSAATSATNAATSATSSSTSATSAASSATSATSSATTAATQATNASTSATAAASSASAASTSATAAASSATSAASSATSAATAQTNAETAQTNAETAETNAANSATSAASSATSAAASYDSFDDRYLGAKSSAPTLDNDGDALLTGALYYNTVIGQLYIWNGSAWDDAAFSASGAVTSFNTRTGSVTLSATDVNTALGSNAVLDSDIGSTVQAYDATIVVDADIGSTVQAYSSVLQNTTASYTTAEETKLAGIETAADVTDATNVAAAGAVMDTDFLTNGLMKRTGAGTYTIVTDNSSEWDTAYSWGNHASAGYLTSYTETDPVYTASSWYTTTNNSTNWDTAYGWGNHASAGYLTSEADTLNSVTGRGASTTNAITTGDITVTGAGTLRAPTGDLGSIEIDGNGKGGWEGYSIGGRANFMHNNASSYGLYDDVNSQWSITANMLGSTDICYAGSIKIATTSGGAAVTGDLTATGNVTAYYSDDRLKTNLGKIENALEKVESLDGFYYEANETAQALGYKATKEVGVSAQSVEKIMPEVVAPAPIDEQYLTVRYERLVPLLIEAVKELSAEVKKLKGV